MGVRDLNYLLKRYNKKSIREITLYDLKDKRIAIDLSLYLQKALIQGKDPIEEIHRQIIHLERYKIVPIYVFDGKPPPEKRDELQKRAMKKARSLEVIKYLEAIYLRDDKVEDPDVKNVVVAKINELKKNSISINKQIKTRVKKLCNIMKVRYVDNMNMEADKAIGILYKNGEIDGCISEDNDMLVYGCNNLYRFYKPNSNHILDYNLTEIKKDLDLSDEEFIDLCILCGCDYYKNIRFKSPMKSALVALYLIRKYGCIEGIKENKNYLPEDLDYVKIREIYNIQPELIDFPNTPA